MGSWIEWRPNMHPLCVSFGSMCNFCPIYYISTPSPIGAIWSVTITICTISTALRHGLWELQPRYLDQLAGPREEMCQSMYAQYLIALDTRPSITLALGPKMS